METLFKAMSIDRTTLGGKSVKKKRKRVRIELYRVQENREDSASEVRKQQPVR